MQIKCHILYFSSHKVKQFAWMKILILVFKIICFDGFEFTLYWIFQTIWFCDFKNHFFCYLVFELKI